MSSFFWINTRRGVSSKIIYIIRRGKIMDVDIETLIGGIFCLGYVVYGALVKGGFWRQNWTNKGGRWVSAAEGPIFFLFMIVLFLTLGIVLTLEGFNII